MIYLKYFESLSSIPEREKIKILCKTFDIKNYTINKDLSIDVDGDVSLRYLNIIKLPLKFKSVSGNFFIDNNKLKTLENCPIDIGGDFYAYKNNFESLKFFPKKIGGDIYISYNKIKNLEGLPDIVNGSLYVNRCSLTSLLGCPRIIEDIFSAANNSIKSIKGGPLKCKDMILNSNLIEKLEYKPDVKNNFSIEDNNISTLINFPNSKYYSVKYNDNLPQEILDNSNVLDKIISWQEDYSIWTKDGKLREKNFQELLENI